MALITTIEARPYTILRNAVAQANTGQTDWVLVPDWAIYAQLFLNITAVAGTTPIVTPAFLAVDPVTLDDGDAPILATMTTPPTAAGTHLISIGPGVSPADDLVLAATGDSFGSFNYPLPPILGCQLTLDRTTGNETYTYTYAIRFRK